MKIYVLVGTRPNFIKVTRFKEVAATYSDVDIQIIHTGQHYDRKMADVFFEQFKMQPDYFLDTPPGTPNQQLAEIMIRLEKLFNEIGNPDIFLVPGDVNSTLAGAITASKMNIKLGHIESGLRSFDRTMPEEVNRVVIDHISDFYLVTEQSGLDHIKNENLRGEVFFVGNTMIDTIVKFEDEIDASPVLEENGLKANEYILMTMHRPATVDFSEGLTNVLELLESVTKRFKVLFPIHPRTKSNLEKHGLLGRLEAIENLVIGGPMDYFAFQKSTKNAKLILTDSGGIQEESTFYGVPCLTLRPNTERPITIEVGTNTMITFDIDLIQGLIDDIENGSYKKGEIPELWDGKATERIIKHLMEL
ncbi:MAG: UDP-N-acetylglucosamine 2-epimerase (non-hydrolyzing) [Flavobacteriales bacterium]|nr:UDP-N-acetylglucosamine 2-epimerase (non-hydrolyzing) [Flavobacteriales bacterium]